MLARQPPFPPADPMEWVHCHIARQPVPPNERVAGVPGPLSAIVMKLLTKTAEQRYQTAAGVEADLRRGLAEWESHGRIDPFSLGAYDTSDRLLIPEKLYGREREIEALIALFDRVAANGTLELVLVSGYPGIGKSSVVNELHRALVPPRSLFAVGKFDQYKRDVPYATLAQAFQSLIQMVLGRNELELARWRDLIKTALGPNGRLIASLIPDLELVIGPQPPLPDLSPQDAPNRFQLVFRNFIGVFAKPEHPLVLFLDDLQWLDGATLDLIQHLLTRQEMRNLMIIGAYRGSELSSSHPLHLAVDAIPRSGARVELIALSPLRPEDLSQMIGDTLRCPEGRSRPLAKLIHEKTGGNPFFVSQFIRELVEEQFLAFDHSASA